jgi:hypothetical protein
MKPSTNIPANGAPDERSLGFEFVYPYEFAWQYKSTRTLYLTYFIVTLIAIVN